MDYRKLFKSKWFTAACFEDSKPVTLKITDVTVEVVENESGKEERPCIHFEKCKPLVLNKTNARAIASLHGAEADDWKGKEVTLRESVTTYRGEEVPCVRVKK